MDYFEPKTVSEAISILARQGEGAKVIAGGTDVLVDMKFKETPASLVNIKRIPGLSFIRQNGNSVVIGPLTTIREIETNSFLRETFSVLWDAAHGWLLAATHCEKFFALSGFASRTGLDRLFWLA